MQSRRYTCASSIQAPMTPQLYHFPAVVTTSQSLRVILKKPSVGVSYLTRSLLFEPGRLAMACAACVSTARHRSRVSLSIFLHGCQAVCAA